MRHGPSRRLERVSGGWERRNRLGSWVRERSRGVRRAGGVLRASYFDAVILRSGQNERTRVGVTQISGSAPTDDTGGRRTRGYPFGCRLLGVAGAVGAEAERVMRPLILLGLLVAACCESRHAAPTLASRTSNLAPPSANSDTTPQLGGLSHPNSQVALAGEALVEENTDYTVAGTGLRVRLHDATRANLPEGHAWRGGLSVCDGAECTELHLGGPYVEPVTWHGYRFELLFVIPTSLRITRIADHDGPTTP